MFKGLKTKVEEKQQMSHIDAIIPPLDQAPQPPTPLPDPEPLIKTHTDPLTTPLKQSTATTHETPVETPKASSFFSALRKTVGDMASKATGATPSHGEDLKGKTALFKVESDHADVEESSVTPEAFAQLSKKVEKYKAKLTEVVTSYKELQAQNEVLQNQLVGLQDSSKRQISELLEAQKLDQGAKQHLAQSFQEQLEEKDEKIKAYHIQIEALKTMERERQTGDGGAAALKDQVSKLEALLGKCRETLKANKEKIKTLTAENERLKTSSGTVPPTAGSSWMHENHAKVMTLFRQFDRNGDGQISTAEFAKGCQSIGIPCTQQDIQTLVSSLDSDQSGTIDYYEFFRALKKHAGIEPIPLQTLSSSESQQPLLEQLSKDQKISQLEAECRRLKETSDVRAAAFETEKIKSLEYIEKLKEIAKSLNKDLKEARKSDTGGEAARLEFLSQVEEAHKTRDEAVQKATAIQEEFGNLSIKFSELQSQAASSSEELSALKASSTTDSRVEALEQEKAKIQSRFQKLKEAASTFPEQVAALNATISSTQQELESSKQREDQLRKEIAECQSALETSKATNAAVSESLQLCQVDLDQRTTELNLAQDAHKVVVQELQEKYEKASNATYKAIDGLQTSKETEINELQAKLALFEETESALKLQLANLEQAQVEMKATISALSTEKDELVNSAASVNSHVLDLESQLWSVQEQLDASISNQNSGLQRVDELSKQNLQHESNLVALREQLATSEVVIEKLEQDIASLESSRTSEKKKIKAEHHQFLLNIDELRQASQVTTQQLEAKILELSNQHSTIASEKDALLKSCQELEAKVSELTSTIDANAKELSEVQSVANAKVMAFEEQLHHSVAKSDSLQQQLQQLQNAGTDAEVLKEQLTVEWSSKFAEQVALVENLKSRLTSAESDLTESRRSLESANLQLLSVTEECRGAKENLESVRLEFESHLQASAKQLQDAISQKEDVQKLVSETEKRHSDLQAELSEKVTQFEAKQAQHLQQLETELQHSEQQRKELEELQTSSSTRVKVLEDQISSLQSDISQKIQDLERQSAIEKQYFEKIAEMESNAALLERTIQERTSTFDSTTADLKGLEAKVAQLSTELMTKDANLAAIQAENDSLRVSIDDNSKRLSKFEQERASLQSKLDSNKELQDEVVSLKSEIELASKKALEQANTLSVAQSSLNQVSEEFLQFQLHSKSTVNDLEKQLSEAHHTIETQRGEIQSTQSDFEKLKSQLALQAGLVEKLSIENTQMQSRVDELSTSLNQSQDMVKGLQQRLDDHARAEGSLAEKLTEDLKLAKAAFEVQIRTISDERDKAQAKFGELKKKAQGINELLKEAKQKLADAETTASKTNDDLLARDESISSLRVELEQAREESRKSQGNLTESESLISKQQDEIQALSSSSAHLQQLLNEQTQALATKAESFEQLQTNFQSLKSEMETVSSEANQLRDQIGTVQKSESSMTQQMLALSNQLEQREIQITTLNADADKSQAAARQLEEEFTRSQAHTADLVQQVQAREDEIADVRSQLQHLSSELSSARDKKLHLQTQASELEAKITLLSSSQSSQVAELQASLSQSQDELEKQTSLVEKYKEKVQALNSELKSSKAALAASEAAAQEAKQDLDTQLEKVKTLSASLAELEASQLNCSDQTDTLEERVKELEDAVLLEKNLVVDATSEKLTLSETVVALKAKVQEMEVQLQKSVLSVDNVQRELHDKVAECAKLGTDKASLEVLIAEQNALQKETLSGHDMVVAELKMQVDASKNEVDSLTSSKSSLETQIQTLQEAHLKELAARDEEASSLRQSSELKQTEALAESKSQQIEEMTQQHQMELEKAELRFVDLESRMKQASAESQVEKENLRYQFERAYQSALQEKQAVGDQARGLEATMHSQQEQLRVFSQQIAQLQDQLRHEADRAREAGSLQKQVDILNETVSSLDQERLLAEEKAQAALAHAATTPSKTNKSRDLEIEERFMYLKNVVFQYLMGVHNPEALVRVMATVLKFSPEEEHKAVEKEVQRQSSWFSSK